jgi:DNA-directed RNA polymerase subunit alpha
MIDLDRKKVTPEEAILYRRVDKLDLCVRALNCLKHANIIYIGELIQKNYQDLRAIRHLGRSAIADIMETLGRAGLSLGMTIKYWKAEEFSSFLSRINNPYN